MDDFQEPDEQPAEISREYVQHLLSGIVTPDLPRGFLSPMMDYLLKSGVLARDGDNLSIAGKAEALRARPDSARNALRSAIGSHASADRHRSLLLYVIAGKGSGGSGSVSQGGGPGVYPTPNRTPSLPTIDDHKWERADCIRSLAGFGPEHAATIVDWIIANRKPAPRLAKSPQDVNHERERLADSPPRPGYGRPGEVRGVPLLRVGQMPARVLVTLLANDGSMIKKDLQRMHVGHDSKDDPRLANLLTPKGDLSTRRLIESIEETVTLTRDGRQEAELQRNRGTRVLGHGNHD